MNIKTNTHVSRESRSVFVVYAFTVVRLAQNIVDDKTAAIAVLGLAAQPSQFRACPPLPHFRGDTCIAAC